MANNDTLFQRLDGIRQSLCGLHASGSRMISGLKALALPHVSGHKISGLARSRAGSPISQSVPPWPTAHLHDRDTNSAPCFQMHCDVAAYGHRLLRHVCSTAILPIRSQRRCNTKATNSHESPRHIHTHRHVIFHRNRKQRWRFDLEIGQLRRNRSCNPSRVPLRRRLKRQVLILRGLPGKFDFHVATNARQGQSRFRQ